MNRIVILALLVVTALAGICALKTESPPIRAQTLLMYGNASQPGSPHIGDQLELSARKEMRPVWRMRVEVEAHLESREVLNRALIYPTQ